jgi:hypothetical protein
MQKNRFGQAYCIDILKRILTKFSLYFCEFYTNFYEYLNFGSILRFKSIRRKKKPAHSVGPPFGPWPGPVGNMTRVTQPVGAHARWRGHRQRAARRGVAASAAAGRTKDGECDGQG